MILKVANPISLLLGTVLSTQARSQYHKMRRGTSSLILLLLSLLAFHVSLSNEKEDSTAPMVRAEQEALYLLIQDLVGKWWNGSELYPDPCGWNQIQVLSIQISISTPSSPLLKHLRTVFTPKYREFRAIWSTKIGTSRD